MTIMPARITPLRPHAIQHAYATSERRFNVVPAGRRSGKSEIAKRRIIRRALRGTAFDFPRFFAGAPTREQAKGIFWDDLKRMTPPSMIKGRPSETELSIRLKHGSSIWVVGFDKPERFEGRPWDGGCLDEYGNTKETVWTNNVQPALADRNGWCDFIGVPEGRNHYYDLYERARMLEMEMGAASEWATFHWKSADILTKEAIDTARRDLDPMTFEQEYLASFINFEGRAYYPFLEATHVRKLTYSADHPLALCFDFNVAPGVAAIAQEQILPGGALGTGIIGEVWIPQNSNTPAVCRKLVEMIGKHRGRITCYGDHTGGARGTAKVTGTDWNIIADELRPVFGDRLYFQVPVNPPERARVNAMNTRLLAGDGTIRMMVDLSKAPQTVRDFEGVRLLKGGSGEIDKKIDPMRTHLCFAAGTMVETNAGVKPIDLLPERGFVRSWDGQFVPYENAGMTRRMTEIVTVSITGGGIVKCTPDHQWLTEAGWVCAKNLSSKSLVEWSSLSATLANGSTAKTSIGTTDRAGISDELAVSLNNIFTEWSGLGSTARSLQGMSSITSTPFDATTMLEIWNLSRGANTPPTTSIIKLLVSCGLGWSDLKRLNWRRLHGIDRMLGELGIANTRAVRSVVDGLASAYIAGLSSWPSGAMPAFAVKNAKPPPAIMPGSTMRYAPALAAAQNSRLTATLGLAIAQKAARAPPLGPKVESVRRTNDEDSYCLSVPSEACFALANGCVVSNCDAIGYYVHSTFPLHRQTVTSQEFRL